ncbi:SDR family oxidoreductase [Paenibacillus sp. GCM10027626]|uniref:SDR family oxidoreductase n=1 Tax=Paenibacillus sp. GCM10027626 TaxID=3273411 RepID=UPI003626AE6B
MDGAYLQDMFGLDNKTAVVTGASKGLGRSMALALGRAGARVCLVGRQDNLRETEALMEEHRCQSISVICDQTTEEGVAAIRDAVVGRWGAWDILVNNAGTFLRKPSVDWTMAEWDAVMDVNLRSVFLLCQAAGKLMLQQRSGKIINIASILGFQGGYTVPAYTASRHAVLGLTKALSNEWAEHGIQVNAIAPGYMDTDQNIALFRDPVRSREMMARIPAKRWGRKDEVDGACLLLASDASDFMNGQVLIVDGGWMGR